MSKKTKKRVPPINIPEQPKSNASIYGAMLARQVAAVMPSARPVAKQSRAKKKPAR